LTAPLIGSVRAPISAQVHGGRDFTQMESQHGSNLDVVRVDRITVEVDSIINPDVEQFFCELTCSIARSFRSPQARGEVAE
jgi:hypothetical protein